MVPTFSKHITPAGIKIAVNKASNKSEGVDRLPEAIFRNYSTYWGTLIGKVIGGTYKYKFPQTRNRGIITIIRKKGDKILGAIDRKL